MGYKILYLDFMFKLMQEEQINLELKRTIELDNIILNETYEFKKMSTSRCSKL